MDGLPSFLHGFASPLQATSGSLLLLLLGRIVLEQLFRSLPHVLLSFVRLRVWIKRFAGDAPPGTPGSPQSPGHGRAFSFVKEINFLEMTGRYLEDFAVGQTFRFDRLQIDESRLLARHLSVSCAYPRQKSSRTFNRTLRRGGRRVDPVISLW